MRRTAGRKKRITAAALTAVFLFSCPAPLRAAEEDKTVYIGSEEDFLLLADQCRAESFSSGKIFYLTADLDLSGYENVFLPVLNGTFDGGGHKIAGVSLTEEISDYGLFRYVAADGIVKNLTVEAEIAGGDAQENIGIVAGSNAGRIQNCISRGSVNAQRSVGGIAGRNEESGVISKSRNEARIDAKDAVGGVAGYNEGTITDCVNTGDINTDQKVKKEMEGDGTLSISVPNAAAGLTEDERANRTGGIAGYSSGDISYCSNEGTIGHRHLGYATGGIVGRQTGGVSYSDNTGMVCGRKDVGGIVGYFEAYEAASYDRDFPEELADRLDDLSASVDELQDASETLGDHLSSNLDQVSGQIKALKDSVRGYLDHYAEKSEGSADALRGQMDALRNTIGGMQYDFNLGKISAHGRQLTEDIRQIGQILASLKNLPDGGAGAHIQNIIDQYESRTEEMEEVLERLDEYVSEQPDRAEASGGGEEDVSGGDSDEEGASGAGDFGGEDSGDSSAPANGGETGPQAGSESGTKQEPDSEPGDEPETEEPAQEAGVSHGMTTVSFVRTTAPGEQANPPGSSDDTPNQTPDDTAAALLKLKELNEDVQKQLAGIAEALGGISGEAQKLHDDFRAVGKNMDDTANVVEEELNSWRDDLGDMRGDLRARGDGISDSLDTVTDTFDSDWDVVSDKVHRVKEQFDSVRAVISDGLDELRNRIEERTVYVDVSEFAAREAGAGKILSCTNLGEIYSDSRGGGIIGSIEKDRAGDVSGWLFDEENKDNDFGNSITRHVMAAVFDCVNKGEVCVENNYAGGIAGAASYGIIVSCGNYGDVRSDNGSYAGGIAGESCHTIRDCYVLSGVSGTAFVGGAAGKGEDITGNYVCSYMDMDDYVKSSGAVAGQADGIVETNCFVDNGYGAVDGVTRSSEALAVDYASMLEQKEMPSDFTEFTIRFMDGKDIVWQDEFSYGDEFSEEMYPALPDAETGYVYWESRNISPVHRNVTIHAVYRAHVPSLASDAEEKPAILLGGDFYPDSAFTARAATGEEKESVLKKLRGRKMLPRYVVKEVFVYHIEQEEPLSGQVSLRVRDDKYLSDCLMVLTEDMDVASDVQKADKTGSYLAAEVSMSGSGYIVVLNKVDRRLAIAGVLLAALLGGGAVRFIKKRRAKAQPEGENV